MLRLKTILQYNIIYVSLLLVAIFFSYLKFNNQKSVYENGVHEIGGILLDVSTNGDVIQLTIKAREKIKCTYYASSIEELKKYASLTLGATILVKGEMKTPLHNTIPNTFDYHAYLKQNEIYHVMVIQNIQILNKGVSVSYKLKNALNSYLKTFKAQDYLFLFITGNKSYLNDGVYENYQELGVSHVFAISGMHISIMSTILLTFLKKLKIKESIRYMIVISFLFFFLFITNYAPSVQRSIALFIGLYLNKRFMLELKTLNVYFLSISFLLFFKPFLLFQIGFIYSSITSFSLICFAKEVKGNYLVSLLKVSSIAFLFSLPITLYTSYQINIFSIINNLFIVPLISIIVYPLSLLTLLVPFLDPVLYIVTRVLENLSKYLLLYTISIPKLSKLIIFLYYIGLFLFYKTKKKSIFISLCLILFVWKNHYLLDSSYYVYFLDVGQGDATVIRYKNECILIDTGGKISYTKEEWQERKEYPLADSLKTFLYSVGITKINALLLTHGDFDHMGEAINLVDNFKVEKVIFNCGLYNNLEGKLIEVLDGKNIKYYSCIKESIIGNNRLYFLNFKKYENENDNSNVLFIKFNNYKFLFMGDASSITEKDILNKYDLFHIDVLKVGHHGSKTSSSQDFIDTINPKYSIISVGKNNRYGHPNKEVLENLKHSKLYRTDLDGSVMFKIINNRLIVETYMP